MMKENSTKSSYNGVSMSRLEQLIMALFVVFVLMGFDVLGRRIKALDNKCCCCRCEPCGCCDGCSCSKTGCTCASGQHCGALGCKCSVPEIRPLPLPTGGPCPKKKKAALPNPKTPLLTAVIHDGQARIAWIDEDGQRQETTLPEEEFCKLTAKGDDE